MEYNFDFFKNQYNTLKVFCNPIFQNFYNFLKILVSNIFNTTLFILFIIYIFHPILWDNILLYFMHNPENSLETLPNEEVSNTFEKPKSNVVMNTITLSALLYTACAVTYVIYRLGVN